MVTFPWPVFLRSAKIPHGIVKVLSVLDGKPSTLDELVAALKTDTLTAAEIVVWLMDRGFVEKHGDIFYITDDGRQYLRGVTGSRAKQPRGIGLILSLVATGMFAVLALMFLG
jgi:predicted transcriptional regulator